MYKCICAYSQKGFLRELESPVEKFNISLFMLCSSPQSRGMIMGKISILGFRWTYAVQLKGDCMLVLFDG